MLRLRIGTPGNLLTEDEWSLCFDESTGKFYLNHWWTTINERHAWLNEEKLPCTMLSTIVASELEKLGFVRDGKQ